MMPKRSLFVFVVLFFMLTGVSAQQSDLKPAGPDSIKITDSTKNIDTISANIPKNLADSLHKILPVNTIAEPVLNKILQNNSYLNSKGKPMNFIQSLRKPGSKDVIFYSLAIIVLLFAILKFLYARYFSNLFRVFFNTSLRQGQLTDQLLQDKLPSLLFNVFFILLGGWYLYLLLNFFGKTGSQSKWQILFICAASLLVIYLIKFCILKFTGWVTGYKQEADTYIFIIFLINKIVAICLTPLIIIIAFADKDLADIAVLVSYIIIAVMILMRFLRSYSLLQSRLKVSRLHFFIYIAGIEIIPLLVIYKLALIFMSKNL